MNLLLLHKELSVLISCFVWTMLFWIENLLWFDNGIIAFTRNSLPSSATDFMSNLYIYIYIYIYIYSGTFKKFPDFLYRHCCRRLKIHYLIAIHLIRWLTNFYDCRFKWTATTAIRIHPTKAWLLQLLNFKSAIWTWGHFRRTICNKILF